MGTVLDGDQALRLRVGEGPKQDMVDQRENYWAYIREVAIPARLSSGKNWRGAYHGIMTNGPGSLGTARVIGGSGLFSSLESEAVESLSARGDAAKTGPRARSGNLTITLPEVLEPEPVSAAEAE